MECEAKINTQERSREGKADRRGSVEGGENVREREIES